MTLQGKSCLKCISHKCGKEYPIPVFEFNCTCGNLLDVKYNDTPSQNLKEVFYQRRNPQGSIFNESGVWRFRELLNFCEIDTEDLTQCSQHLVSLDGAEGRLSKPYHMSKVAKFVGIENEKLMLQPEGYNPSGSFKDNGMSTAVTHAKLVGAKKIICASTGNTSASAGMYASLLGTCPESLLLDNDFLGASMRITKGFSDDSKESLCFEAVKDVCLNNRGHYLGSEQTINVMQSEYIYPELSDRDSPNDWKDKGKRLILDGAIVRKKEILATHFPNHISDSTDEELRKKFKIQLSRKAIGRKPL